MDKMTTADLDMRDHMAARAHQPDSQAIRDVLQAIVDQSRVGYGDKPVSSSKRVNYPATLYHAAIEALKATPLADPYHAPAEKVAEAAAAFCSELQEDAEGVPQPQLTALHEALNVWDGIGMRTGPHDDSTPLTSALAGLEMLERDPHATDWQRRIASRALTVFSPADPCAPLVEALAFYESEWEQDVDAERTAHGWTGSVGDIEPSSRLLDDKGDRARSILAAHRERRA